MGLFMTKKKLTNKKIFWGSLASLFILGSIFIVTNKNQQANIGEKTSSNMISLTTTPPPLAYNPHISTYPTPIINPDWKSYTSKIVGYSFAAPSQWRAEIFDDASVFSFHAQKGDISQDDPNGAFFDISFPISTQGTQGLVGLENSSNWAMSAEYITNNYITIEGRKTLIVKSRSTTNPPGNLRSGWCSQCSTKYVYINLGNGKILKISGYWGPNRSDFEPVFDKIVSSIHFIR